MGSEDVLRLSPSRLTLHMNWDTHVCAALRWLTFPLKLAWLPALTPVVIHSTACHAAGNTKVAGEILLQTSFIESPPEPGQGCIFKLSLPPAMSQTTKHLLQGLPDWLTSDGAQHPVIDLLGARAQDWQPGRPSAMKRKAGGVLHLWRVLLAGAATTSTCAGAKTSHPAQGVFRAGNGQSTVKKQI